MLTQVSTHMHGSKHAHSEQALLPEKPALRSGLPLTRNGGEKGAEADPKPWSRSPYPICPACILALLSAVRINGDGQEILYLAEGDNARLGCPYILDPEDYGPNGLDIEWKQVNSEPSHRENVVSDSLWVRDSPYSTLHSIYLLGS